MARFGEDGEVLVGDAGVLDGEGVAAGHPPDPDGGVGSVLEGFALSRALQHYQLQMRRLHFSFSLDFREFVAKCA